MRRPLYDLRSRRKTVSLSLNADLVEKARAAGINISRTAEAALAAAFIAHEREVVLVDLREAAEFTNGIVAEYGLPFGEFLSDTDDPDSADNAA